MNQISEFGSSHKACHSLSYQKSVQIESFPHRDCVFADLGKSLFICVFKSAWVAWRLYSFICNLNLKSHKAQKFV